MGKRNHSLVIKINFLHQKIPTTQKRGTLMKLKKKKNINTKESLFNNNNIKTEEYSLI